MGFISLICFRFLATDNCTKMIVSFLKNKQLPIVMSGLDYTNADSEKQSRPSHENIGFIRSQTKSYQCHLKTQNHPRHSEKNFKVN